MAGELTKREEALTLSQVQARREETARPVSTGQNQSQRRRLAEAIAETAREASGPDDAADAVETMLRCFGISPESFKWGDIITQAMFAEGLNKFQAVKDMAIRQVVASRDRETPMLDDGELAERVREWFMDSPPPLEDVLRAVERARTGVLCSYCRVKSALYLNAAHLLDGTRHVLTQAERESAWAARRRAPVVPSAGGTQPR